MLVHHADAQPQRVLGEWKRTGPEGVSNLPEVGERSPERILVSVVFPAPFSPRSPRTSPGRTSRSTPLRATVPSG